MQDLIGKIHNEDCRETMKRMPDNSIDSIVTDPPYELGFMGKKWDNSGIAYNVELWKECLRVLKPGGYLLAFGGTRTQHRMVCAIEDAGFEIRDTILWIYGSGFPKSLDILKAIDKQAGAKRENILNENGEQVWTSQKQGKKSMFDGGKERPATYPATYWQGWGTALKPAVEPICMARKPLSEKTVAQNVLKWGTGGININGCRIELDGTENLNAIQKGNIYGNGEIYGKAEQKHITSTYKSNDRFPANVILSDDEEVLSQFPNSTSGKMDSISKGKNYGIYGKYAGHHVTAEASEGSAARFFYIAKSDQSERNDGLHQFDKKFDSSRPWCTEESDRDRIATRLVSKSGKNNHPTVKPIKLMQYLQRMVTPKGGLTYDPFGGSGTSALSASNEQLKWILSELSPEYCDIATKRIYNNNGLFNNT
jgi:DNA modification methylase